jgi:hypothetical protein
MEIMCGAARETNGVDAHEDSTTTARALGHQDQNRVPRDREEGSATAAATVQL